MAGHPLCFVLSVRSVKSVVNSVFGSGSAGLRTDAPYLRGQVQRHDARKILRSGSG